MKKIISVCVIALLIAGLFLADTKLNVLAEDTIYNGIFIEDVDVSGMTAEQARAAVLEYIDSFKESEVSFLVAQGNVVTTTIGNLSPTWSNQEIIDEAFSVANEGNVIQRYKAIKDVQHKGMKYNIDILFDEGAVYDFVANECAQYDLSVKNPKLKKTESGFVVEDGVEGEAVDVETSVRYICNNLFENFKQGVNQMELAVTSVSPDANAEDLYAIKDVIGTFTTNYSTSGPNRSKNVENGCRLINGATIYPGEEFSCYDAIKPFSTANGYYEAPSYMNGQVVDSLGGGICQVSSTLYNAVILAELQVTERYPHSMVVTYVNKSADAAISESGKDFKFVNTTDYPIYIEGYCTENKRVTFNIYGVESRPSNRRVEYVSEVISETVPAVDNLIADPGAFIGSFSVTQAHIGYKAKLWKVVYEDGVEVSREQYNSSTYNPSPRTAKVGVLTGDPDAYNRMAAAISTGNLDMCKATAALILSGQ